MTPDQLKRVPKVRRLFEDNRPVASWIVEQLNEDETLEFDELESTDPLQRVLPMLVERLESAGRSGESEMVRLRITQSQTDKELDDTQTLTVSPPTT